MEKGRPFRYDHPQNGATNGRVFQTGVRNEFAVFILLRIQ